MKKVTRILASICVLIIFIKSFDLFIYPIPIETRAKALSSFNILLFPLSIAGLSTVLIIKYINKKQRGKYLMISIGAFGLISSFIISVVLSITGDAIYADKFIVFQSVDNKNDMIIQQFADNGPLGSSRREVRAGRTIMGIRYSNRFYTTTLNGKWIHRDNKSQKTDTINCDNFIYKSEFNEENNWTIINSK